MNEWLWLLLWSVSGSAIGLVIYSRTRYGALIGPIGGAILGPVPVWLFLLDRPKGIREVKRLSIKTNIREATMDDFIRCICVTCGKTLKAKSQLRKKVRCSCGQVMRVPGQVEEDDNSPVPKEEQTIAPMAYAAMFSAVPILMIPFLFVFPLTFGFLALRDINRNPRYIGKGRSIFGIIWGFIGLFLTLLFVLIIAASAGSR